MAERGGAEFCVWAPRAETVVVRVQPRAGSARHVPLARADHPAGEGAGYHVGSDPAALAGDRYGFCLDGSRPFPDPASRHQPDGVHGLSALVGEAFDWSSDCPTAAPFEQWVIYELHVGTFTRAGSFDAVIAELERLKSLGVSAIELMPVAQFPGARNWGYDGVYPFAPQDSYGGPLGLKRLVDACRRLGLATILDVVYNHLGPEGNYLGQFGPYFTDRYRTPWGEALNFDGPASDAVRRYFLECSRQWLCEYRFDALRLDAVHTICDGSALPFLEELAESAEGWSREQGRALRLIAESDTNDARLVSPRASGGIGLTSMWCDDFHHAAHQLLTGESNGYYADFGGVAPLAAAWQRGVAYEGQYSRYRDRRHGRRASGLEPSRTVAYVQNHDQVGNRPRGERLAALCTPEQLRLAAALVCLVPAVPMLFMGEEWGATEPFLYFVDHGDPDLAERVRLGREGEARAFSWAELGPDPSLASTFESSVLGPPAPLGEALTAWYQTLLALRRLRPSAGREERAQALEEQRTLWVRRGADVMFFFCFAETPQDVRVLATAGRWERALDTARSASTSLERWLGGEPPRGPAVALVQCGGGADFGPQVRDDRGECRELSVLLQPHSFVCYARRLDGDLAR